MATSTITLSPVTINTSTTEVDWVGDSSTSIGTVPAALTLDGVEALITRLRLVNHDDSDPTNREVRINLVENSPPFDSSDAVDFSHSVASSERAFTVKVSGLVDLILPGPTYPDLGGSITRADPHSYYTYRVGPDAASYGSTNDPIRNFILNYHNLIDSGATPAVSLVISDEYVAVALDPEKILKANPSGGIDEAITVQQGGSSNADKIASLNNNGRWPLSMMPTGIGPEVARLETRANLSAGNFVSIVAGTGGHVGEYVVVQADASNKSRPAHGFVKESHIIGTRATVYLSGINDQLTGVTPATPYLSTTAGEMTTTAPTGVGEYVQILGTPVSSTSIFFEPSEIIEVV